MKSRKQALADGDKQYHGKPCKNCATTLKFTSSWGCVQCTTERTVNRDPDVYKRYIKSEKGQEWIKEFRRSKTYRNVQNKWSVETGFHREQQARRRKQIKGSYNELSASDKERIERIYMEAARLTTDTGIMYHVDHIVPLFEGGDHHPDNLQIITAEEHRAKCSAENKRRLK